MLPQPEAAESPYLYLADIASGGMGRVELVMRKERNFERFYACKRIHPRLAKDKTFVDMFFDEARIAGHLRHANIVSVLDVGEDATGPFMLMDYVDGLALADVLHIYREEGAFLPVQVVLRIIQDVARGLHAAHEARSSTGEELGIIHRDVSPSNILIGFDGTVRLSDFGVAKAMGRVSETNTGGVKGKFAYMSPEQIQARALDRRTDLFSLGIVLGEALTGNSLFDGPLGPSRIVDQPPPDIEEARDEIPMDAVELFYHLMAKDPAQRLEPMIARMANVEGPLLLADFLEQHFGEERERRADWLIAAVEGTARSASVQPGDVTEPASQDERSTSGDTTTATVAELTDAVVPRVPARRNWELPLAAVLIGLVGVVGVVTLQSPPAPAPVDRPPVPSEVPRRDLTSHAIRTPPVAPSPNEEVELPEETTSEVDVPSVQPTPIPRASSRRSTRSTDTRPRAREAFSPNTTTPSAPADAPVATSSSQSTAMTEPVREPEPPRRLGLDYGRRD